MAYIEPVTVALKKGKRACIRTRTLEDAPGTQAFMEAVFRDDRFFLSTQEESKQWLTFDVYRNRTETFNGHDAKLLLVAEADGKLVATSDVDCEEKSRNRHVGKIGISIRTDYCGIGLGTELMKVMIDWATAHRSASGEAGPTNTSHPKQEANELLLCRLVAITP